MFDILNNIIKSYKGDEFIELEFRLNIDVTQQLINTLTNKQKIVREKTINCIKNMDGTNIIYQIFINNSKKKAKLYQKRRISKPIINQVNDIKFKINISEEINVLHENYDINSCDLVRIKNRISINSPSLNTVKLKNWRLDITHVKTLGYVPQFDTANFDKCMKKISDEDGVESTELELEYIGDISKLSKKDINICLEYISNFPTSNDSIIYRDLLIRLAKWIQPDNLGKYMSGIWGLKQLIPQVVSLDISIAYNRLLPNIEKYYISPKIDGIRTVIIIDHDENRYFTIGSEAKEIDLVDFGCKEKMGGSVNPNETIMDTELYDNTYFIYDIITYKGKLLIDNDYNERLIYIDKVLDDFMGCMYLVKKPIFSLNKNWKTVFNKVLHEKWDFNIDGWIFTPGRSDNTVNIKSDYINGKAIKWKTIDMLSIDFLLRNNNLYAGIKKTEAEKLYSEAMNKENWHKSYGPLIFCPTYKPANIVEINKISKISLKNTKTNEEIVEVVWNKNKWEIIKVRNDRQVEVARGNYFGNNYKIAELIWHSIFWLIESKHFIEYNTNKQDIKMINYLEKNNIANENKLYFYKLYTYLIRSNKYKNINKLIDIGIIYPYFNYIVNENIVDMDFVVSDGFSCLNIINQKYDRRFISDPKPIINISAYTIDDYISFMKRNTKKEKRLIMSMFPTDEQLKFIENICFPSKENHFFNSEDVFKIITDRNKIRNKKGKKISEIFSTDNFSGNLSDIYLFSF